MLVEEVFPVCEFLLRVQKRTHGCPRLLLLNAGNLVQTRTYSCNPNSVEHREGGKIFAVAFRLLAVCLQYENSLRPIPILSEICYYATQKLLNTRMTSRTVSFVRWILPDLAVVVRGHYPIRAAGQVRLAVVFQQRADWQRVPWRLRAQPS